MLTVSGLIDRVGIGLGGSARETVGRRHSSLYASGAALSQRTAAVSPQRYKSVSFHSYEETGTFRSTSELRNEVEPRAPVKSDNTLMTLSFTRTLRLKIRREAYAWLDAAAIEVNQVFNFCNETSLKAATRTDTKRKWMSGFDLCNLTAGASQYFDKIGANTIQSVCTHYAQKRRAAGRLKLRWRKSSGRGRSLGWVPFKAASLKRKGVCLRFAGKCMRVFERERLEGVQWQGGCFAQDAVGDWWLCLPVRMEAEQSIAPQEAVGIDLGLKDIAVTSDGDRLSGGRWTQRYAATLASAQRRGHKRQAKRIHRKAARCRADALHKFSRKIVDRYQYIAVGDVSSLKLVKTRMAKSVLDSGWGCSRTSWNTRASRRPGRSKSSMKDTPPSPVFLAG